MVRFQNYLASLPQQIYNTTQYLRYYALPYMPQPQTHPSFQELFAPEWQEQLTQRLDLLLDTIATQKTSEPTLIRMIRSAFQRSPSIERVSQMEQVLAEIQSIKQENEQLKIKEAGQSDKITLIQVSLIQFEE